MPMNSVAANFGVWLISATSLAMLFGHVPPGHDTIAMLSLGIAMALAMREISLADFLKSFNKRMMATTLMANYGLIMLATVPMAYLFFKGTEIYGGFIVVVAMPPAVALVPFARMLDADMKIATSGEVFLYIVSLGMCPLIVYIFLRFTTNIFPILRALFLLVILPMAAAQGLARLKIKKEHAQTAINLMFFILIYIVISLNRSMIIDNYRLLPLISGIALTRTVGTATVVLLLMKKYKDKNQTASYALFGSLKNSGLAMIVAMNAISYTAALPAAITVFFEFFLILYLQFCKKLLVM